MADDPGNVKLEDAGKKGSESGIRTPSLTELSAIGAATLYTVGFVVANAYYARYELVRFEFFRGRYVAAALLFASAALIPSYFAWGIGYRYRRGEIDEKNRDRAARIAARRRESSATGDVSPAAAVPERRPWPASKRDRQLLALTLLLIMALLAAIPTWALLELAAVGHISFWWVAVFGFGVECPIASVGSFATKIRFARVPAWNYLTPVRTVLVFFGMLVAGALFGGEIYPYLSPAYGGGAATRARIELKPASVPAALEVALKRPVALIDRDEQLVNLVACTDSGAFEIRPVALPTASVEAVVLSTLVAVPEAARQLCTSAPP